MGWVQHLRHASFGEANTRLILSAYWLAIIIVGLAIVLQLSSIYEVDTRRKVFHFMMVAMLLPATYVDPTYAALALILMLAIFLLLDLFRASQLPPLSKHLAYFLTPYVDGRDLKGPVVISHIFLLIGCAIPLWLSLASLPRTGTDYLIGWEVPTRDVSMVSGVICVGMGDAAASLIGRRYGRRKWIWGGGKSIEGSVAFATAVGMALILAKAWLRIGGWPSNNHDSWFMTIGKAGVAAWVASLTEAVLTGGNDNVVVPVVLWLCVKGLDI
jgi:dolichol kinase